VLSGATHLVASAIVIGSLGVALRIAFTAESEDS
jgi:hypothetical protein